MAVTIHGNMNCREYDAALALQPILRELLGSDQNEARIVVGAFTPGVGPVEEMDLVVLARCIRPIAIPTEFLPQDLQSKPAVLSDFALAIEVKELPPERITFEGTDVKVRYHHRVTGRLEEKSATTQVQKQPHVLREFMERHRGEKASPWWLSALWLRNVPTAQIPAHFTNVLGASPQANDFLRLLVALREEGLRYSMKEGHFKSYLSCCSKKQCAELIGAMELFTRKIEPTEQERKKIEKITKRTTSREMPGYLSEVGTLLLRFRGRGGSGKTVRLLQLAHQLREEKGNRVLFLTYNKALAADLRRLLAIMGIREKSDGATISIETSQKYFYAVLRAWKMAPDGSFEDQGYGERFELAKQELATLIGKEVATSLRKESVWNDESFLTDWNIVMIDEAQDWFDYERDILSSVFGPERLVIADGVDQLTRRDGRCDWLANVPTDRRKSVNLTKSLRLKSNICRFIRAFADEADLPWDLEINEEVLGGRIILIHGPYTREQHDYVMSGHARLGNKPIDALFCVTTAAGAAGGNVAQRLKEWGEKVWDGTSKDIRDTYPDDLAQFRVVRYESCRGLEGWTAVCLDFDRFSQRQFQTRKEQPADSLYQDLDTTAKQFAARWGMIPMTRAIDTLVLQVSPATPIADILRRLAAKHPDFVEQRGEST